MTFIPSLVLRRLYNRSSLKNVDGKVRFSVKNRLSGAKIKSLVHLLLDSKSVCLEKITLEMMDGRAVSAASVGADSPLEFNKGESIVIVLEVPPLVDGHHFIELQLDTHPYGRLELTVEDDVTSTPQKGQIPRHPEDDYSEDAIKARQEYFERECDVSLNHVKQYSFDPHETQGNIEHFTGVAQVPLGVAGPLKVNGQHAQGDFYVPLACTEGTLVASYNRGMKLLNASGGVKCAVIGDNMQRAPVFIFDDAANARALADWIGKNESEIKAIAEATDQFLNLKYVDYYLAHKFCYLRFNYTTGDAGGQNMVGKATFAACNWVAANYKGGIIRNFYLESNFATDKKASMINMMRSRGKRVVAEATVPRQVLKELMRVDTVDLHSHSLVANQGSMMSGANNNGLHSANAITAIFLACGQDVADVSESSMAMLYTELTEEKDLYISITLPSLIIATCGGGTGLPTQRECLQIMGCCGPGKVMKLAEIIAGTVLAGELSLASAISSLDWVSSHDRMGRNAPVGASL